MSSSYRQYDTWCKEWQASLGDHNCHAELEPKTFDCLIRYVGEKYSNSQEAMEDTMRSFYNEGPPQQHLSKPVVGQLVAVRGEDEDELTRAQVMEVMEPDKVKVMNSAQLGWRLSGCLKKDIL